MFFVSLFVVSLTNLLNFQGCESRSYQLLFRLDTKEDLRREAVNLLNSAYRERCVKIKDAGNKGKLISAQRNFRKYLMRFVAVARYAPLPLTPLQAGAHGGLHGGRLRNRVPAPGAEHLDRGQQSHDRGIR